MRAKILEIKLLRAAHFFNSKTVNYDYVRHKKVFQKSKLLRSNFIFWKYIRGI